MNGSLSKLCDNRANRSEMSKDRVSKAKCVEKGNRKGIKRDESKKGTKKGRSPQLTMTHVGMFDQFVYLSHVSWKKVEGRSAIKYVMARELCEESP